QSSHQGYTQNMAIEQKIPGESENSVQVPRSIFDRDIVPPVAKFTLPEAGGRIASTSQLAYCLSLLPPSSISREGLSTYEYDWSRAKENDPDEQRRLRTMATDVVRAFIRDELKTSVVVAEIVNLAAVLDQDEFRKLTEVFIDGIEQSLLLKIHLLDGLAHLIRNASMGNLDSDDLVKILEVLSMRLKGTHWQSSQHTYQLAVTVSQVLDSMVDCQVKGVEPELLLQPLSEYLMKLQESSVPSLVYQAAYAYQALQYVPDDETILQATLRRTGMVVQGISGIVSAVKSLDLGEFIGGLQSIQEGLSNAGKAAAAIKDAYKNVKSLSESGKGVLETLQEGFSFTRKSAWYPALRGLDILLQEGRFAEFEKLIRESPCRLDPAFQWGVCQRLGELAANSFWDVNTRQHAVSFLGEMYTDDAQWGKQPDIKQWILLIIGELTESSEGIVANRAKSLLQDFETDGDPQKQACYQASIKETRSPILLKTVLPSPHGPSLTECVQNIPDVETPLRQLKWERLRDRGTDVYISPRAKINASAKEDFDLTSKVLEFLKSNKK
ncbi:hypothetical protein BGX27_004594, partial [Mortierella sp. AM989]